MKVEVFYEFTGDTEDGMGYIHGSEYPLTILRRSLLNRAAGMFFIPFSWKVVILTPIAVPYESEQAFQENWKHKRTRISW